METDIQTLIALLIIGLGTARLTALIVLDEITEPLRDLVFHYFPPADNDARGFYYQCYAKASDAERKQAKDWGHNWYRRRWTHMGDVMREPSFAGRLLSCHKCMGVWVAVANTGAYMLWPEPALIVNFALASAFASIILIGKHWR